MKLKKLFSAKKIVESLIILSCIFVLFSCASKSISLIPGASAANAKGIINEYINIGDTYFSLQKYDKAADTDG